MSIAAEAFAEEQAIDGTDIKILLHRFGCYFGSLGTQTVTIPVSNIVEDMLETFTLACMKASEVQTFAWARSGDLQATLEDFIRTRECLFDTDRCLPAVEATFGRCSHQIEGELAVELHYAWNPPKVNFETFQNVFDESRTFHLEPRINQPCSGFETSYSVDQSVPITKWNASEGCFEGYCPPFLASSVGAQRLECFSMPLNMNAKVTTRFPGMVKLERTIRLEIPITIRRRPDACSSDEKLEHSPAVRKPAVSVLVSSTDTTPQSVEPLSAGKDAELNNFWPNYKEMSGLMDRKARAASVKPFPPLRLNPLSLAQLWDATAPTPSAKEVQCWTMGFGQQSSPVQLETPSKCRLRISTGSRKRSPSKVERTTPSKTTPSKTHRRVEEGRVEKSVQKTNQIVLTKQLLKAVEYSPKHDPASRDDGQPGPSKQSFSLSPSKTRIESPVVSAPEKAINKFSLTKKQSHFPAAKAARRTLFRRERQDSVFSIPSKESGGVSPERLMEWRKAPERLNEAEKDVLQSAIQAAHQRELEEREKDQEVDESLLVEGDGESLDNDF